MTIDASKTYAYTAANLTRVYVEGSELTDRGSWMPIGSYAIADVVDFGDALYFCIAGNTGMAPTGVLDDYWTPLVEINDNTPVESSGSDIYARELAGAAQNTANAALQVGSSAYELAESAYALAASGTASGAAAFGIASSAYTLAQIGTNTGTAALLAAADAQSTADAAYLLAQVGTNAADDAQTTADAAFTLASAGTDAAFFAQSRADAAYLLAQIGTNTGTAAYDLAAAAYALATAGTAAGEAYDLAGAAYTLAQIGTNTGTAAYALAAEAYALASAGTTAGAAYSLADAAYALAQIGTNTGTAAYTLAVESDDKFTFGGTFYGPIQIEQFKQVVQGVGTYASPRLQLLEADSPLNYRRTDLVHQSGTFYGRFYAEEGQNWNWLAVSRTGSVANTIDLVAGTLRYGPTHSNLAKVWTAGNDGSNSGLDADRLDGLEGEYYSGLAEAAYNLAQIGTNTGTAAYNRFELGGTMHGQLQIETANSARLILYETDQAPNNRRADIVYQFGTLYSRFYEDDITKTKNWLAVAHSGSQATRISFFADTIFANNGTVWTSVNDGPASGLDADLLDGQHGAYYTDLAASGSNLAWAAYQLAQIGTETGGGGDGPLAQDAWNLAQIGTNVGTNAYELAQEALDEFDRILTNGRCALLVLCSAYTPLSTGPDLAQVVVPHEFDGSQVIDWTLRRVTLRVADFGSSPSIAIEKSTGAGIFSATQLTVLTMGSNAYEAASAGIFGTVSSGDKLRMNVLDMGSAQNWFVSVQLYHPFE